MIEPSMIRLIIHHRSRLILIMVSVRTRDYRSARRGFMKHGGKRGLWLAFAIEKQRIVRAAARGKVIEPGIAIGYSPKRDPAHRAAMLHEDAEQLRVACGELLLYVIR